jgi:2-enoate reductase
MNKFPKLFENIFIGRVALKNRIVMAPMGINGFWDPAGTLNRRGIDYYLERARGGVGLIITGLFKVENIVEPDNGRLPRISPSLVPALAEICESSHSLGVKVFVQLTAGWGRVSRSANFHHPPASPSPVPCFWNPRVTTRALSVEEIESIVNAFGTAARIVASAGVDGIELHGHEGYLFDQFSTALWNQRTDCYGGDLKSRLTFTIQVLSEIKKSAGADFPVQYRMGLKHYIKKANVGALPGESFSEAGRDIEEGLEMAGLLEEAGFSSLHIDAGCYDSWYWPHPPVYQKHGCMADLAARVKHKVKIPVMAVGRLDLPELAEEIIGQHKADLIALGRGLLADPEWPLKVLEGRVADIRPCTGCHEGCMGRLSSGKPLSCAVNPACGRERLYALRPAHQKKNIIIVGGGLAGMEAARVAAIRGHQVTIYEKNGMPGGRLLEASVPGFKTDLKRLLKWYEKQLQDLNVKFNLESPASTELIRRENPEVILIATGATPAMATQFRENNSANTFTAVDALAGNKAAGQLVLVVGGGLTGCEVALWLAQQGKTVTLVEALPELMSSGQKVPEMNRLMLLDLLAYHHVRVLTETKVKEIHEGEISLVEGNSSEFKLKVDTTIIAAGLEPDNRLYYQLKNEFARIYILGDCREPGNIMGAIWDAYEVARCI